MKRSIQLFAAVLCVAAMLSFALPVRPLWFWTAAFVVAAAVAVAGGGAPGTSAGVARGGFLCDSCKYDNERDCYRPERPNATQCPDYKQRGS